jgi:chromosome segregation ATPase
MHTPSAFSTRKIHSLLAMLIPVLLIMACQTTLTKPTGQTADPSLDCVRLSKEKRDLEKSLARSEATRKELEEKLADSQVRFLEKDAQVRALEQHVTSQQKMLDDAVVEVVRAKAKLRSLDSRAEAASNMAEAEISVKALKVELGAKEQDPDVLKAEHLLKMSSDEFKNENYGGALYLTNQAKARIEACQMRLRSRKGTTLDNETQFTRPLALKVLKSSHLKEEPNPKSKTIAKLEKGTRLMAYGHKGEWTRVTCETGRTGWVLQSVLGSR